MLFPNLKIWLDPIPRSGPENMAVDEWVMKGAGEVPVLRVYGWKDAWVSLGYFQSVAEARRIFGDDPEYVRRWTGGGIVDHRDDLTYTLAIPREDELAKTRGGESYCAIHAEIARCLGEGGIACQLTREDSTSQSAACFEKPVVWDLLGNDGRKLAGAGQRRTRWGILHQGSVAAEKGSLDELGGFLSRNCEAIAPDEPEVWEEIAAKYQSEKWLVRVP